MVLKKRVVIACVSFEVAMVVRPAVEYGADEIHLFHYIRSGNNPDAAVYADFYDEVCRQLREQLPKVNIIEHRDEPVYSFQPMLRALLGTVAGVRRDCPEADLFVNVSSGPSEFSAAAIIVAMMTPGASAFTVSTKEYTVSTPQLREAYYSNGRPVGLSAEVYSPRPLPSFFITKPDEGLVRALRVYADQRTRREPVTAVTVIGLLREAGLWDYTPVAADRKTEPKQKEVMYYQRHYIDSWVRLGWLDKPARGAKYDLTDAGQNIIDTFYR